MTYGKLTCLLIFYSILFGSGGFDNGTATGKGKFQIDIALGYTIRLKNSFLESISINVGGFRPVTWSPDAYFLPTYSLDFKFK